MHQIAAAAVRARAALLIAIGLGGYALWRLAQALVGHTPEYGEHSTLDRIGAAGSAVAYAALLPARDQRASRHDSNSSAKTKKTTAGVLEWPAGRELVAAAGLLFIGIAHLPGLPWAEQEVPRVLQDRPDVPQSRLRGLHRRSAWSASSPAPSRSR